MSSKSQRGKLELRGINSQFEVAPIGFSTNLTAVSASNAVINVLVSGFVNTGDALTMSYDIDGGSTLDIVLDPVAAAADDSGFIGGAELAADIVANGTPTPSATLTSDSAGNIEIDVNAESFADAFFVGFSVVEA